MVLAEEGTGNMIICEHSMVLSDKDEQSRTKFVVSVKPKIYCIPKIFPSVDELNNKGQSLGVQSKLVDFCYVKSPANHILSTSQYLLVTVHKNILNEDVEINENEMPQGGYMRLWNTNDGRCIMISPLNMFNQFRIPFRVILLADYIQQAEPNFGGVKSKKNAKSSEVLNGLVLCVCESEEIFIVNVYTMTIVYKFEQDFHDIQSCNFDVVDSVLMITILDKTAKVSIIRTSKFGG